MDTRSILLLVLGVIVLLVLFHFAMKQGCSREGYTFSPDDTACFNNQKSIENECYKDCDNDPDPIGCGQNCPVLYAEGIAYCIEQSSSFPQAAKDRIICESTNDQYQQCVEWASELGEDQTQCDNEYKPLLAQYNCQKYGY